MLEKVNLKKTMMNAEYKQLTRPMKEELGVLQHAVKDRGIPFAILLEGWGTAGKGSVIADVILNLDPRNYKVLSTVPATEEERRKPFLWRHWMRIPERGQIAIFDRSWYPEVSVDRVEGAVKDGEARRRLESINVFERQLTDDGYHIIKLFLHISQKDQKKRLEKLAQSKETAWRATERDWKRNKQYDAYSAAFDEMLESTNTEHAPWHIISCHDKNSALAEIYTILTDELRCAVAEYDRRRQNPPEQPTGAPEAPEGFQLMKMPLLSEVRLDMTVDDEKYKELLEKDHRKLAKLHNELYRKKIPVVVVYEGWDAAGKGGNIRRIVAAMDPRGCEVVPIAAPGKTELAHHYLWRFWRELPKRGHVTIFDRSWYGRLMVERVEGFCTPADWHRAYRETNEFERELTNWGAIVVKFWLQVDKDEQLRRFEDRQNTPEKQWKITDEDWRNREKWDLHEAAVNDMLRLTSTDYAPWTIVESQDKKFARLKAIETFINAVEARL